MWSVRDLWSLKWKMQDCEDKAESSSCGYIHCCVLQGSIFSWCLLFLSLFLIWWRLEFKSKAGCVHQCIWRYNVWVCESLLVVIQLPSNVRFASLIFHVKWKMVHSPLYVLVSLRLESDWVSIQVLMCFVWGWRVLLHGIFDFLIARKETDWSWIWWEWITTLHFRLWCVQVCSCADADNSMMCFRARKCTGVSDDCCLLHSMCLDLSQMRAS